MTSPVSIGRNFLKPIEWQNHESSALVIGIVVIVALMFIAWVLSSKEDDSSN